MVPNFVPDDCEDLIRSMVVVDPDKRLTVSFRINADYDEL